MIIEPKNLHWVKSSYSDNGGTCVEWAPTHAATTGTVPIRDSKTPNGSRLSIPVKAFSSFVAAIKAEEFGTS